MKLIFLAFLTLLITSVSAQVDTSQHIIPGRVNSKKQQAKPYVILISADGFRYNYPEQHHAEHLLALSKDGIRAQSMIPSYPSLTFPNHYTLITGLYPAHHGISQNDFYSPARREFYSMNSKGNIKDSGWYGGTPLWTLAEQQKMLAASFYWVASETAVKGVHQTYYYQYNTKISIHNRIQTVVNWLKLPPEKRPHLITFYFPEVDHEGHTYGPDSPETGKAVRYVDSAIYQLTQAVKTTGLKVNFVFVADHGMTNVDKPNPLTIPTYDTTKFKIEGDGILLELYANNKNDIMPTYQKLKAEAKDYQVYLKGNTPAHMHYRQADDKKGTIGDILLIPTWPKVFKYKNRKINPGWHGFDPYMVKDMHAIFMAWGPAFKKGVTVPSFPNVDVFPMVSKILGLPYRFKIDGTMELANKVLKQ